MWSKKGRHKRGKRKEGWIEGRTEREKEHKREEKIKRQKGKEKEWKGERSKQGNERKGGEERKGKGETSKIRKEFYANFVLSFKEKSTPSGNTRAACLDRFRLDLPQGALPDTSGLKAIVFSISHSSISLQLCLRKARAEMGGSCTAPTAQCQWKHQTGWRHALQIKAHLCWCCRTWGLNRISTMNHFSHGSPVCLSRFLKISLRVHMKNVNWPVGDKFLEAGLWA